MSKEKLEISADQQQHILKEFQFYASKSSGPGGQHVNKTNSKVMLKWNIETSSLINQTQKQLLLHKLSLSNGVLSISCDSERSQLQNKRIAIKKIFVILKRTLKVPIVRKASKPTKSSVRKRLDSKKQKAQKKENRKPPTF
jgi:ribosome-associated protein